MRWYRLRSNWLHMVSTPSMSSTRNPRSLSSTLSLARRLCLKWIVLKSSKGCCLLVDPARLQMDNSNSPSRRLRKRTICWLCCKVVLVEHRRHLWIKSIRSCRHSQNLLTRVTQDSLRQATSNLRRSSHFRRSRDSRVVVCLSHPNPLGSSKETFGKTVRRYIHPSKTSITSYKTWLVCPLDRVTPTPMDFTTTRRCRTRNSNSSRICQECHLDRAILARTDLVIRRCTTCRLNILPSRCSRQDKRQFQDLKCRVSMVQLLQDLQRRTLLNFHHRDFPRSP
jgi:hypothetical protein